MSAPTATSDVRNLTPRQLEVLELLAKGLTNKEIAGVMGIAFGTVRHHVSAVIGALGVDNRTEAAVALQELGLGQAKPTGEPEDSPHFQVPGFGARPALAVLPFESLDRDSDDFLADGIVDDLITRLAQWRWFPVIARNSSFAYKDRAVDVATASRELGARYVVTGSVRRGGDRIRVAVQLLDGTTSRQVWAESYDREIGDVFALQDEIVLTVVAALEPAITRIERFRSVRREPETLDAWLCLHRGMHHLLLGTKEGAEEALHWLGQAQHLDPGFAQAWAAEALCHGGSLFFQLSDSPADAVAGMVRCADEALRCDPMDPFAVVVSGMAQLITGRRDAATRSFETAVSLMPSYSFAHMGLCMVLRFDDDRVDDAIEAGRAALRLSPHDPLNYLTCMVLSSAILMTRRWEEALEVARRALELNPAALHSYLVIAACEGHLGRLDAARAALDVLVGHGMSFARPHHRIFQPEKVITFSEEGWAKAGFVVPPDEPDATNG